MTSAEIAKRIEEELKRRGIKKSEFYEKCGVSRASFSQWRHNLHYPTREALAKINEFLGLSFSVMEDGDQKETPTVHEGGGLSETEKELRAIIRGMTEAEKVLMLEKAKQIKEI